MFKSLTKLCNVQRALQAQFSAAACGGGSFPPGRRLAPPPAAAGQFGASAWLQPYGLLALGFTNRPVWSQIWLRSQLNKTLRASVGGRQDRQAPRVQRAATRAARAAAPLQSPRPAHGALWARMRAGEGLLWTRLRPSNPKLGLDAAGCELVSGASVPPRQ